MAGASPTGNMPRERISARRLRIGLALILVMLLVLGFRLFYLQALDPAGWAKAAVGKRLTRVDVPAIRGSILDTNGKVLARSVERFDLVVDQTHADAFRDDGYERLNTATDDELDKETVSLDQGLRELADALDQDVDTLSAALLGEDPYSVIATGVTPQVKDRAVAVHFPGIYAKSTVERIYPKGQVAGSIVGFMNAEGPAAGLELMQNERLSGEPGNKTFEIGGDGIRIPYATNEVVPAKDGQSIRLTINEDLQWYAQQVISAQVEEYNAQWGNIVVAEVDTGKIRAMAESTTPDPNNPGKTPSEFRLPLSVTASYEPGSTTKLITMAAALEEGIIEPNSKFEIPAKYTVDGQTFSDAFEHGTVHMTAAGIFAKSMNTGTVMIGEQLSKQKRYEWLQKFGIGQPTGIGLNGATAGLLAKPEDWDVRQQYTVLFGQGLAQTSLHTAMAYQIIANDGVRLKPQLVEAYVDPDGTEHKIEPEEGTRVVSEKTASTLRKMLETVTEKGSGKQGKLDEYRVGSKTGTAEASSPQGGYDGYTLAYAGMAPLESPKYVVVVTLQRPQGDLYYLLPGSSFKKVMLRVLQMNNVPPSTGKPETFPIEY